MDNANGTGGAEVAQLLSQDDRRRRGRDRGDRQGRAVDVERYLVEAAVSERRLGERGHTAPGRLRVDVDLRPLAADLDAVLPELDRCGFGKLERLDFLQARLVAAALDPRGRTELVEELGELPRRGVDHLHVALLRLAEVVRADQGLREAVDGR